MPVFQLKITSLPHDQPFYLSVFLKNQFIIFRHTRCRWAKSLKTTKSLFFDWIWLLHVFRHLFYFLLIECNLELALFWMSCASSIWAFFVLFPALFASLPLPQLRSRNITIVILKDILSHTNHISVKLWWNLFWHTVVMEIYLISKRHMNIQYCSVSMSLPPEGQHFPQG